MCRSTTTPSLPLPVFAHSLHSITPPSPPPPPASRLFFFSVLSVLLCACYSLHWSLQKTLAHSHNAGIMKFYTDDAPGLRIGPTVVLVFSLAFIGCVVLLHIWGKFKG